MSFGMSCALKSPARTSVSPPSILLPFPTRRKSDAVWFGATGEVPASNPLLETTMQALSEEQTATRLKTLPGWEITRGELVRTYKFEDFRASLRFVNQVADL